jgi:hypothetical protein
MTKKHEKPDCPEDLSIPVPFREVDTQHVNVSTYKGSITIQLPGGDFHWFSLADAKRLHVALGRVIKRRAERNAWAKRYAPDSWEAKKHQVNRRRSRARKRR